MKYAALIGLFGLLSAGLVFAQGDQIRVNIPFEFVAGDKALPAGDYRVSLDALAHRVTLFLKDNSVALGLSAHTAWRGTGTADTAKLVFHRYGNTSFLRSVWNADQAAGYEFARTKHEREMAKVWKGVQVAVVRR